MALGMLTHVCLDAFFWFAPLDLFWPFSHLPADRPILPVLDLWAPARPLPAVLGKKDLLVNLREAFDFAAFALYLMALRPGTDDRVGGEPATTLMTQADGTVTALQERPGRWRVRLTKADSPRS